MASLAIGRLDSDSFLRTNRIHFKVTLLPDVHLLELSSRISNVVLAGSVDVIFWVLKELNPMSNPACNSGDGKEHRVHISWEAHSSVDQAAVEINVGIKFAADEVLVRQGDSFELQCDFN